MSRLLGLLRPLMDPETLGYQNRINAAGSSIGYQSLRLTDQLIRGLKTDGLRSSMVDVWPCAGTTLAGALVKLIYPSSDISSLINTNFSDGNYSESVGLTGDGTSKYLNTQLVPGTHLSSDSSVHLSLHGNSTNAASATEMGANDGTNQFSLILKNGNLLIFDNFDNTTTRISATNNNAIGFCVGSRTSNADARIYRNGDEVGSKTVALNTRPAIPLYVFARNNSSTAGGLTNRTLSFYSIGSGLSPTQVKALTARVQTYQKGLGRSV